MRCPMADEEAPTVTLYVDASVIVNASTSANAVIHSFVQQFSKEYAEKAKEVDKLLIEKSE
jgi:hypothetical protein